MNHGGKKPMRKADEWIIQRCTQRWIGFELEYEDFPTPEGVMTRDLMMVALERVSREHPGDEFRGHRVVPCHREDDANVTGTRPRLREL